MPALQSQLKSFDERYAITGTLACRLLHRGSRSSTSKIFGPCPTSDWQAASKASDEALVSRADDGVTKHQITVVAVG
jgi:hypothetical protein